MKAGKKKLLVLSLKILTVLVAYLILHKLGVNPFWSILALMYWRTILALGLVLGGLIYITMPFMQ